MFLTASLFIVLSECFDQYDGSYFPALYRPYSIDTGRLGSKLNGTGLYVPHRERGSFYVNPFQLEYPILVLDDTSWSAPPSGATKVED